jgi:hypothetical protein
MRLFVAPALAAALRLSQTVPPPPVVQPGAPPPYVVPAPLELRPPTYFEEHLARVQSDLVNLPWTDPEGHPWEEPLDALRGRDRLLGLGAPLATNATGYGTILFAGAVVFSAHAPPPVRRLFGRALHFGPALMGDAFGIGAGGEF